MRIYEYAAPTILHAKHMSVDDLVSVVGSSNMDIRSFQLDLELMMLVSGRSFTDQLKAVEDEYRSQVEGADARGLAGPRPRSTPSSTGSRGSPPPCSSRTPLVHIGIDLAWGANGRTGLAAVDAAGALVDSASVRTDDEIDAWLAVARARRRWSASTRR